MTELRDPPRLEGEAEVDLGRHATAVAARWWLVLLGLVAGVVVALLLSVGGKDVYRAAALIYPGQALGPTGSGQVQTAGSNPSTIREIVRSEAALRRAANASGYGAPARLRGNVSVQPVSGNVARLGQVQLTNVVVTGDAPRRTAAAANELAKSVIARTAGYADTKIRAYEDQIAAAERELETLDARAAATQAVLDDPELSSVVRFQALTLLAIAEQRRSTVQTDLSTRQQLLALARDVERPRVLEPAVARKVTAQSRRNQLIVGAAIGLLLGLAAALAWEPALDRLRRP